MPDFIPYHIICARVEKKAGTGVYVGSKLPSLGTFVFVQSLFTKYGETALVLKDLNFVGRFMVDLS